MFDSYIFDLDGVLVDVHDNYKHRVFEEVGEVFNTEFTEEQVLNLWHGVGAGSRDEILRSWGYEPRDFWRVFDEIDTPERRIKHTYAYSDADALDNIDACMGVVTHSPPELAEPALEKTGLLDRFDSIVCCSHELGYKPEPAPIRKCAEELGAGDKTIMIGDSASDIYGAWNAGLTAGHIDRVGHKINADINIKSLAEIPDFAADGGVTPP